MLTKQKLIIFDFLELLLKIRYNNILNNNNILTFFNNLRYYFSNVFISQVHFAV